MCYVCKKDISRGPGGGYEHFEHGPFRPGAKKCLLYDIEGIDRHKNETDDAEREAIRKIKADDKDLDEEHLRIGTRKDDAGLLTKDQTVVENAYENLHQYHHGHQHQYNFAPPPLFQGLGNFGPDHWFGGMEHMAGRLDQFALGIDQNFGRINQILGGVGGANPPVAPLDFPPMLRPLGPGPQPPMHAEVGFRLLEAHGQGRNLHVQQIHQDYRAASMGPNNAHAHLNGKVAQERVAHAEGQQEQHTHHAQRRAEAWEARDHTAIRRLGRRGGRSRRHLHGDQSDANVDAELREMLDRRVRMAECMAGQAHQVLANPPYVEPLIPGARAEMPERPVALLENLESMLNTTVMPGGDPFISGQVGRARCHIPEFHAPSPAMRQQRRNIQNP